MGFFDFVGDQLSSGFKQITGQREGILGSAVDSFVPGGSAFRDVAGGVSSIVGGGDGGSPELHTTGITAGGTRATGGLQLGGSYGASPGITQGRGSDGPSWLQRRLDDLDTVREGVEIGEDIVDDLTGDDDDGGNDYDDRQSPVNIPRAAVGGLLENPAVQLAGGVGLSLLLIKALDL